MPLLSPQHSAVLLDALTWMDNPFFWRDARRDNKRRQLTKSLAWLTLAMIVLGGLATLGLIGLKGTRFRAYWLLGGDVYTAICIVISGLHVWFIANVSQKHTMQMMTQEAFRNTLSHLLMLPSGPFRILLQASIYPWWAGMRLALLLLPVYIFFVGIGSLTWAELVMLYFVFATVAFTLPMWRRPALADNVAVTSPTPQRTPVAVTAAATNQNATTQGAASGGLNGGMLLAFFIPFFLFFIMSANRRGFGGMYQALHPYVPDSLLTLMPTSMFSWPLLLARGVITPLDWYGLSVPPLIFFLLLFPVNRYLQIVRTSEYFQVGAFRDLAQLPTYLPRRRWEGVLRIGQFFVVLGYLWRWAIWNGGLNFLSTQAIKTAPGLDSFAYLLLFVLAWRLLIRCSQLGSWLRGEKPDVERALVRVVTLRSALRYLLEPIAFTFGFYLLCCAISRTPPFPPPVLTLGGKMLALAIAGGLLSFGIERFALFGLSYVLRIGVFLGPFIGALYYNMPETRQLAYFSPTLGFIGLGNPAIVGLAALYQPPMPWENWIRYGGSLGLVLTILGVALAFRRKPAVEEGNAVLVDPTKVGYEIYVEEGQQPKKKTKDEGENPWRQRLVAGMQRLGDNAVAIKEIRGRLKGRQDLIVSRYLLGICLVATLVLYQGMPIIPQVFGGAMAKALFGPVRMPSVQIMANILACWYILMLFLAFGIGFTTMKAFTQERDKSTLGFMLMTPMSSGAIVVGKAVGMLSSNALFLVVLLVWTLLMSLGLFPLQGPVMIEIWFAMALSALALFSTVGMVTLACASLTTRWTLSQTAWAWIMMIFIQVVIFGTQFAWGPVSHFVESLGLSGITLWLLFLVGCILIVALSYLVSVWSIQGLRKRDLAFAASKREN